MTVPAPLRRAGAVLAGFLIGYTTGAARAGVLLSLSILALTFACVEVTARLTEEE
jgi:hypothetical protein